MKNVATSDKMTFEHPLNGRRKLLDRTDEINISHFLFWLAIGLCLILLTVYLQPQRLPLLGIVLALIVIMAKPEYPYLMVIIAFPIQSFLFQISGDTQKNLFFVDLFILCTLFAWCISYLARRRYPYPGTCTDWFLILFFGWALISLFWTSDVFQGAFQVFRLFICYSAFALSIALITNEKMLKTVWGLFIFMGVIEAIVCVISIYSSYWILEEYKISENIGLDIYFWGRNALYGQGIGGRAEGTGVPHSMGVYLVSPIFLCIGFFLVTESLKKRLLQSAAIMLMIGGVLATLTKSALFSFWLGMAFIIFHMRPLRNWFVTSLVLLFSITVALFFLVHIGDIEKSLTYHSKQLESKRQGTSMETRLSWWKGGLKKLVDTYGFGYGAGGYVRKVGLPVPDGAHPAVFFEFGIIGSLLWILIFGNSFLYFYRNLFASGSEFFSRLLLAYLGGYVAILISWLVTLNYDYIDLFLYLGLGYALVGVSKYEPAPECKMCWYDEEESLIAPLVPK